MISSGSTSSGNDWAIVGLFPNSNTGRTAAAAQDDFYRLAKGLVPSQNDLLRITGFGADDTPSGPELSDSGFCRNSGYKAQQTASGYLSGTGGISTNSFRTDIPIAGASSGSPLIYDDNIGLAIGILLHGSPQIVHNGDTLYLRLKSTSQRFSRQALKDGINDFPGSNVFYVDSGYPAMYGEGSQGNFFNPFLTVEDAVQEASNGGIVSMVKGHYPGDFTIDVKSGTLTLEAPVGKVTIGGSVSLGKIADDKPAELVDPGDEVKTYSLSKNYPNPFNPTTVIEYSIPEQVEVQLAVYDILGRRVSTLVNEMQPSGTHQINWDASNMASGVYIYRLEACDFVQSQQMMLIK